MKSFISRRGLTLLVALMYTGVVVWVIVAVRNTRPVNTPSNVPNTESSAIETSADDLPTPRRTFRQELPLDTRKDGTSPFYYDVVYRVLWTDAETGISLLGMDDGQMIITDDASILAISVGSFITFDINPDGTIANQPSLVPAENIYFGKAESGNVGP